MAKARIKEKMETVGMDLPECQICGQVYTAPIYNCQSGHSLCANCNSSLLLNICPICREPMTQIRNRVLEEMISKAKVYCPNKAQGCKYILKSQDVDDHTKECIFREMPCPLGAIFGKCSWNGFLKDIMNHFKECHPENCNVSVDSEVQLDKISFKVDDHRVFLVAQNKMLFIVTMKMDTIHKMAYWSVQRMGSQRIAEQHVYEVHIGSKQDSRRTVTFNEYCFDDLTKPDEIFRQGKCAIMPFSMLNHFINDNKLAFKFLIKRIFPVNTKHEHEKVVRSRASSRESNASEPSGPRPSRSPGFRGRAPRGRPNNRGYIRSHSKPI